MKFLRVMSAWTTSFLMVSGSLGIEGCNASEKASTSAAQEATQSATAPSDPQAMQLPEVNLTSDGLDELLAPIALYPDPVLAVMLQSAVDPQQVMDGGNWLAIDTNSSLKEAALDQASSAAGFTPVMQALLHYPTVVDMMCTEFDWTKQLGAAYQADPKAVLASVQRLRAQAVDNGALKSSPEMNVDITQDQGQQVVELKPGDSKTVYIPQYDPAVVYSTTTTVSKNGNTTTTTTTTTGTPPPTSTTTVNNTTVVQEKSGVDTGTAVLIGLLSFGAGIAVGSAINSNHYYYPAWGYGGVWYGPRPYYPPPYRPIYHPGWGGGYYYHRPVHYQQTNIYINRSNNYYNRFNNNGNLNPNYKPRPVPYNNNPNGTLANNMGNRPANKNGVNYRPGNTATTRPAGGANPGAVQRPTTGNTANAGQRPAQGNNANNWKGQSTYQGNKNVQNRPSTMPGNANAGNMNRVGGSQPARTPSGDRGFPTAGGTRPSTGNTQARPSTGNAQASRPSTGNAQASRPAASTPSSRPSTQPATRPTTQPANRPPSNGGGAFGGANNPQSDRAASNRGRSSMGAPAAKPAAGGGKKKR
ncbi:MAG TPA: DUF3300 domain-containing protein [Candidatus Eisenbacteria bacterium]|nr:DUF3300 domain-containing protein [Candidatus Eisenbacteria bacterium]